MSPSHLAELLQYTQHQAGTTAERQCAFVAAYFDQTDPDEILARGPITLYAMAHAHWRLLESPRPPQQPLVRVYNPTLAEDGYVREHTVIQIVNADMPFLVDSVTMAINRARRTAHWVVHPLLRVLRDAAGQVTSVQNAAQAASDAAAQAPVESLILVECDRIVEAGEREALAQSLRQVLRDVYAAVGDWAAMLARCEALAQAPAAAAYPEDQQFLGWLRERNFTFLGARDYALEGSVPLLVPVAGTGLGILRNEGEADAEIPTSEALALASSPELLLVTKTMARATVHRPAWMDCIAVKRFDASGKVVGETRFLGLYTAAAYFASAQSIPRVRSRVAAVVAAAAVVPDSHAAKSLHSILQVYPRDELFQIDTPTLIEHAVGILRLQERQRSRVFLRRDPFGRYTSALVFVPRERFNTELRVKIEAELLATLDGQSIEFTPTLSDDPLARIHFLVRARALAPNQVNLAALEGRVARLTQRWEDECTAELLRSQGEGPGLALARRFAQAFPAAYREDFSPAVGCEDVLTLAALDAQQPLSVKLYRTLDARADALRFKLYHTGKVALSDSLPLLERMGARVLDERPYGIAQEGPGGTLWIHDLGLQFAQAVDLASIKDRFEALFAEVWTGTVESDDLNRLVLCTGLDSAAISVLRAYTRYFKQLGYAFSQSYIEATLNRHPQIAERIAELFAARFDPDRPGDRDAAQQALLHAIEADLQQVASLEEDRVLRQFVAAVRSTLRTNHWQRDASQQRRPCLALKLDTRALPGVPEPRPLVEIWVYAPRVEALHLRMGRVARGGLRWSDRREDFRTEVLGLVKAQQVKNAVIVPVGSKGGFVPKQAPSPQDREAWAAEGVACYKLFIASLLDLTDNLVHGAVVPPPQVVRHDGDDPYLVVAADKGTASFSDVANAISLERGFWLGDAFASGGSQGYDHKKMGITARGAWEAAKRHFRVLRHDTQTTPFTVAGIGDMSGDVFGNGMLLSQHIRLVAAFDHRHIFIDPNPDPQVSFAERQRLFALPRSSWDDYDKALLSVGGGVYPRSAKSIALSPEARAALGVEQTELAPVDLLRAILQAPVDLLYNGGIGTYVKASDETHAQVGDKAGDAFRIDGRDLRCKVLVEGGNLGCTQRGRIEFAQRGGLIYTDAIDNSGGVDCSDHEVNIKILLGAMVEAGDLTLKQRNELLAAMTDDVARLVLQDNYYQTQALDVAGHRAAEWLDTQQRLMHALEAAHRLNRALEFLPTDDAMAQRRGRQQGLTAPENAVLLAYSKMAVYDDLLASDLPEDPYYARTLQAYFPPLLAERCAPAMGQHRLRREIIATAITNAVLNRMGATFVHFLRTESGASTADVVRAFALAREVFGLEPLWDQIDALDYQVDAALQLELLGRLIAMAQRASRWMLRDRDRGAGMADLIARYQPTAQALRSHLGDWLHAEAAQQWQRAARDLEQSGVAPALAQDLSALDFIYPALDMAKLSVSTGQALDAVARTYFDVEAALGLAQWRTQVGRLPTHSLWQTQARSSARDDLYTIADALTRKLIEQGDSVQQWQQRYGDAMARLRELLATISDQTADLAPITVALREMRRL